MTPKMYQSQDLPTSLLEQIADAHGDAPERTTSQADLRRGDAHGNDEPPFFDAVILREALEIYSAVRTLQPTNSAEIGFCCGGSGLAILKALEDNGQGTHHVCDPYQTSYARGTGLRNVERAGLSARLRFHEAFPEAVVPGFPTLQFAFIDASHLFDLSMLDFVLIDKRLEVGGVLGFHDLWMPSLQAVVRFLLTNRGYEVYYAPNSPRFAGGSRWRRFVAGLARCVPRADALFTQRVLRPWTEIGIAGNVALLRKTKPDDRDWRHFRPFA